MRTYLSVIGDANDPITWSGTPYHFLQAARTVGLIDEGLGLSRIGKGWQARRISWNLAQILRGRSYGGYQFQHHFLERLYSPEKHRLVGGRIVNCFQVLPPSVVHDTRVEKWFYIDMTLRQLFEFYRVPIDQRNAAEAIARETEGYLAASGIMTLSSWAADSVINDYGIEADRVHPVPPGANLDPQAYARWQAGAEIARPQTNRPPRLVFTGKYWRRKGLDRLIAALNIVRADGMKLSLRVVGIDRGSVPRALQAAEGVEWTGFISKRSAPDRFITTVADCDIGCLLSREDASPIAVREYSALGLIPLCTNVGGTAEMVIPGSSIVLPAQATGEMIADTLLSLCRTPGTLERMRARAWEARHEALWDATCCRILRFWPTRSPAVANASPSARAD